MAVPAAIKKIVASVLKEEAKKGETTTTVAAQKAMLRASRIHKDGSYGLGAALLQHLALQAYSSEVKRQFKRHLPDNVVGLIAPNVPPELRDTISKIDAWIATESGPNAVWVPSFQATQDQWFANYFMKETKSIETVERSRESRDIYEFLKANGFSSLSEAGGV